jgi:hypothetical protein
MSVAHAVLARGHLAERRLALAPLLIGRAGAIAPRLARANAIGGGLLLRFDLAASGVPSLAFALPLLARSRAILVLALLLVRAFASLALGACL